MASDHKTLIVYSTCRSGGQTTHFVILFEDLVEHQVCFHFFYLSMVMKCKCRLIRKICTPLPDSDYVICNKLIQRAKTCKNINGIQPKGN